MDLMLLTIAHSLQSMGWATELRESALVYPVVMMGHLAGMALFGGMIVMTDMRILGLGLKKYPIADVVKGLRPWKHAGLTWTASCGIALAWSEADKYAGNPYFWMKMSFFGLILIHALVFRGSVYSKVEEFDRTAVVPGRAKLAAILSLVLWTGVVSSGRWIGYYEPKDKDRVSEVVSLQFLHTK